MVDYKSTKIELYRRIILVLAVIIGVGMIGYVVPAMVTVEWVDFTKEQAKELKGFATSEKDRIGALPLEDYIKEQTGASLIQLDSAQWGGFFNDVFLASSGQYANSNYGTRVGDKEKELFTPGKNYMKVFFKTDELPIKAWQLQKHQDTVYLSTQINGKNQYLRAIYWDYSNPTDRPYNLPPTKLMNPLRTPGFIILILGIVIAFVLPRSKSEIGDIVYQQGSILAGDILGLILFGAFVALPVFINEGTVQAFMHWPIVTIVFAAMAAPFAFLLYTNGWHASYRLRLIPNGLMRSTFRGMQLYTYQDIVSVEKVLLVYPKWFLHTFKIVFWFSVLSGKGSVGGAGQLLLAESASYAGLEIKNKDGQSIYIWYSDQMGRVILPGYERIIDACQDRGIGYNDEIRIVRGFMYYK